MDENKRFERQLRDWNKEYKTLAKKLGIPFSDLMLLVHQNELLEINRQLFAIHEHLEKSKVLSHES